MSSQVRRKLTTILAADAEGYSRAMEADEVTALGALRAARGVFSRFIERHHGRIANTAGDGLIAEFPSVVEAVQCAIEVQQELDGLDVSQTNGLRFRIGVHLGDVMVDGEDLLGEGVNLAARLQTMAEPGSILISQQVYDQVQKKLSVNFEYVGERRPKNLVDSVTVYSVMPVRFASEDLTQDADKATRSDLKAPAARSTGDLRARVIRRLRLFAAIWVVLLVIDIGTGPSMWAHWPGLILAVLVGYRAAPLIARGWFTVAYVRIAVIAAALLLANLLTWSGYLWALWPAAVIILIVLVGRLFSHPGYPSAKQHQTTPPKRR